MARGPRDRRKEFNCTVVLLAKRPHTRAEGKGVGEGAGGREGGVRVSGGGGLGYGVGR